MAGPAPPPSFLSEHFKLYASGARATSDSASRLSHDLDSDFEPPRNRPLYSLFLDDSPRPDPSGLGTSSSRPTRSGESHANYSSSTYSATNAARAPVLPQPSLGARMRCSGCRGSPSPALYCSKACQVAHWSQHKKICHILSKLTASPLDVEPRDIIPSFLLSDAIQRFISLEKVSFAVNNTLRHALRLFSSSPLDKTHILLVLLCVDPAASSLEQANLQVISSKVISYRESGGLALVERVAGELRADLSFAVVADASRRRSERHPPR